MMGTPPCSAHCSRRPSIQSIRRVRRRPGGGRERTGRAVPGELSIRARLLEMRFEQPIDSLVLIQPGIRVREAVAIQGVWGNSEVVLVQLDQAFIQTHPVLA